MTPEAAWQQLAARRGELPAAPRFRRVDSDGLNDVWKVEHGGSAWALRIPGARVAGLGLDRPRELAVLAEAGRSGLAPRVAAAAPDLGLLATGWLDGATLAPDTAVDLAGVAELLAAVHGLSCLDRQAGYREAVLRYGDLAGVAGAEPCGRALELLDGLEATGPVVTCHNDPTPANVVRVTGAGGSRLVLLDWEYAGPGSAWFDLAAVSEGFRLDEQGRNRLLRLYRHAGGAGAPSPDDGVFTLWIHFYRALCRLWALAVR